MNFVGYEWGYECPKCDTVHNLSGYSLGNVAIINGDKEYRTRALDEGDTLTCRECDYESEV